MDAVLDTRAVGATTAERAAIACILKEGKALGGWGEEAAVERSVNCSSSWSFFSFFFFFRPLVVFLSPRQKVYYILSLSHFRFRFRVRVTRWGVGRE